VDHEWHIAMEFRDSGHGVRLEGYPTTKNIHETLRSFRLVSSVLHQSGSYWSSTLTRKFLLEVETLYPSVSSFYNYYDECMHIFSNFNFMVFDVAFHRYTNPSQSES